MLDHDEPLDPELAALYATERAAPLPEGASARVLAGTLAGISAGATGAAHAAGAGAGVAKGAVVAIALASAIGGGALGILGYRAIATPAPVAIAPIAPIAIDAPIREPDATPDPIVIPDAPLAVVPVDAPPIAVRDVRARDARPDASEPVAGDDTREPLLVDLARTALRRGLIDDALATLMRHERVHPHGAFAEERDVLVIEAYVAKGETVLARRRIERYRREYPSGFLRARIDRAEATLGPP